jgi:release factor glutamine methyltransferase
MGLAFAVDERVMIPRPETEVLVEYVVDTFREHASDGNHNRRSTIDDRQLVLVDVGTGSGCIAVSAAFYLPQAIVYATDISGPALAVARINAERHGTADRIIFLEGDLLFVLPENLRGQVDAVVSNPPYVPKSQRPSLPREVRDFEPAVAVIALEKGTEIHQRLIAESPRWLRPAGLLVLEAGAGQAEAVAAALAEDGRYERARRLRDVAGAERVVVAALRYSPAALSEDGIGGSGSQRANYQ